LSARARSFSFASAMASAAGCTPRRCCETTLEYGMRNQIRVVTKRTCAAGFLRRMKGAHAPATLR
jgi:hypothetical protein